MYFYSRKSRRRIVHTGQCRYSVGTDAGTFPTLEAAVAAGYRLCRVCAPAARRYRREGRQIRSFCAKNGMICFPAGDEIVITTPHSRWRLLVSEADGDTALYHKNTQKRDESTRLKGYHPQAVYRKTVLAYLVYILEHDAYRRQNPCKQKKAPRPAPKKGTKRYLREQQWQKQRERRTQISNVLSLIEQLSDGRPQRQMA